MSLSHVEGGEGPPAAVSQSVPEAGGEFELGEGRWSWARGRSIRVKTVFPDGRTSELEIEDGQVGFESRRMPVLRVRLRVARAWRFLFAGLAAVVRVLARTRFP